MWIPIVLCIALLVCFILAAGVMKTREMEQENRLMQSYMFSMEEFYAGIQSRIDATRKYRHDLAKHIQTLEELMGRQSDSGEIQEYMDNLKQRYDLLKHQEFCRDELVNSILTIKKDQCAERGIPLDVKVEDCIYNGIEEMDIVGLLHNLLDNAVEAQDRITDGGEKGIWFSMRRDEKNIWIHVRNRVQKGEKVTFETSKAKKEEHGIGTKIIENLVEKYSGTMEISADEKEGFFKERIILCYRD